MLLDALVPLWLIAGPAPRLSVRLATLVDLQPKRPGTYQFSVQNGADQVIYPPKTAKRSQYAGKQLHHRAGHLSRYGRRPAQFMAGGLLKNLQILFRIDVDPIAAIVIHEWNN